MSFGRYITGPRTVVAPTDPAIDDAGSDFEAYKADLFDPKHLKFKDGELPTKWDIVQLTEPQKRIARTFGDASGFDFLEFVFRCGVTAIENYPIQEGDSFHEVVQPDRKDRSPLGKCASREWLDGACIVHQDIEMVGTLVWNISEARPLSRKPSEQ